MYQAMHAQLMHECSTEDMYAYLNKNNWQVVWFSVVDILVEHAKGSEEKGGSLSVSSPRTFSVAESQFPSIVSRIELSPMTSLNSYNSCIRSEKWQPVRFCSSFTIWVVAKQHDEYLNTTRVVFNRMCPSI